MDGHATVGGTRSDVGVPFEDTLKHLSGGAMLPVSLEKGRFRRRPYAYVAPDSEVGDVEIDATTDSAQLAVGPYYRLLEWQYGTSSSGCPLLLVVAPEAGFRLAYMRAELEVRGAPTVDGTESWVDPLFGTRLGLDLSVRWTIAGEANIGGFGVGSDFTWSVQAIVGYEASLFGRLVTTLLGYRALSQDYDHNDFEWAVTRHGPSSAARRAFDPLAQRCPAPRWIVWRSRQRFLSPDAAGRLRERARSGVAPPCSGCRGRSVTADQPTPALPRYRRVAPIPICTPRIPRVAWTV
jgi:hypothetical protein